jgi:hypothetical protein
MGLDMNLTAKRYLSEYIPGDSELKQGIKDLNFGAYDLEPIEVSFRVMYWRKANAIHHWFVSNVQDGVDNCAEYYVSEEDLISLRDICVEVLSDNTKAGTLLPTQTGFFFGSLEYDEWYFKDLQYTVNCLNQLFEYDTDNLDFYYSSSW